jgi:hypothetical protein
MTLKSRFNKMEIEIKAMLESFSDKIKKSSKWPSSGEMTKELKNKLCNLGKEKNFFVCASRGRKKDWTEWLYDVTWLKYEGTNLVDIPLALECEWNPDPQEINNDFEKLLQARARLRVMIFWQKSIEAMHIRFNDFEKRIRKFKATQSLDRYLFAGLDWKTGIFEYKLFIPGRGAI